MNLYVRYFDHEFLAKTVDEALSFLTSIDEIKLESNAAVRISTFLNSSNLYPFRLKVSYSNYVLFLKTEAETLEQFKEEEALRKEQNPIVSARWLIGRRLSSMLSTKRKLDGGMQACFSNASSQCLKQENVNTQTRDSVSS